MKIYVCDDSMSDLLKLKHYIAKYAQEQGINLEVREFESAGELLRALDSAQEQPVLIFLDIYMNDLDGMAAARYMRRNGVRTSIIFTTSSQVHAMEAFDVQADGYLHKPFDYEQFKRSISKLGDRLQEDSRSIELRVDRVSTQIKLKDIFYVENGNHCVQVYVPDGELRASTSMEKLREELEEEPAFVSCGRSFLVNFAHVESMDDENLHMTNGDLIPVPVRIRKQIREQYQQFRYR